MNPKVDFYFNKAGKWQEEIRALRSIVLGCGLTEELKWGVPCYTFGGNVLLIHVFKEYCAMLFFKGALLSDADGILVQQTQNVQAARQARFTSVQQVRKAEAILKGYIYEAIEVEKSGLKVDFKKSAEVALTEEFEQKLKELPRLKPAFDALTPGRKRAYMLHFSAPKQSKTRISRIEKCIPRILGGKGLNE
ncbi:MAG TPA: DUF1801 domain-containing protein [Flavisolibacter sp.]